MADIINREFINKSNNHNKNSLIKAIVDEYNIDYEETIYVVEQLYTTWNINYYSIATKEQREKIGLGEIIAYILDVPRDEITEKVPNHQKTTGLNNTKIIKINR